MNSHLLPDYIRTTLNLPARYTRPRALPSSGSRTSPIGQCGNIKFRSAAFTDCCCAVRSLADRPSRVQRPCEIAKSLSPFPSLFLPSFVCNMKERRLTQPFVARCKLVLVGDVQCGKTAMLQVLAKDCYPEVSGY